MSPPIPHRRAARLNALIEGFASADGIRDEVRAKNIRRDLESLSTMGDDETSIPIHGGPEESEFKEHVITSASRSFTTAEDGIIGCEDHYGEIEGPCLLLQQFRVDLTGSKTIPWVQTVVSATRSSACSKASTALFDSPGGTRSGLSIAGVVLRRVKTVLS